EILRARERLNTQELEKTISEKFAGLLTPEIELVELAAQAYADLNGEELVWRKENLDTEQAISKLSALGNRFGYQVIPADEPFDLTWRVEKIIPQSARGSVQEQRIFEDMYGIAVRPRADFDAIVNNPASPLHGLLVIPEPQVALTRERLRRDPRWLKKLERAGWEFLRMPFVEQLLQETWTERPEFQLIWGLEPPIARGKEQMELF